MCFEQTHIFIFIERKQDCFFYQEGQYIVIARSQSELCAVEHSEMEFVWCGFYLFIVFFSKYKHNKAKLLFKNVKQTIDVF